MGSPIFFSTWWLLLLLGVLLVPILLLLFLHERRTKVLALASLIVGALLLTFWLASLRHDIVLNVTFRQTYPDYIDGTDCGIEFLNGDVSLYWSVTRFVGAKGAAILARTLPDLPRTFGMWSSDPTLLGHTILPLMEWPARLHTAWWSDYADVRSAKGAIIGRGAVRAPLNLRFACKGWLLPLPFFLFSAVVYLLGLRRRLTRRKAGHCVRCNYDLRGSPEKCPECGLVVKGGKKVAAAGAAGA